MARIEELLALRASQYQKTVDLYDGKSATLYEGVSELARLRYTKESEEKEMEELESRLFRLQSIDEIHIEIDVLQTSENGIMALKERLYKLNGRLAMARKHSKDLDLEFNVIKPKLIEIKNLYALRERESQRKDHLDFEISRHKQGIEQRIREKKDTILA